MNALNLISFDVPYPPNYGGVIDVFFKIKHLHELGVRVHLHTFEYGRGEQKELKQYCATVTYYKRKTGPKALLSSTPYIVKSRENQTLKMNLLANDFPILFEGIHTCSLLQDSAFNNRTKIVRCHNIEHEYYNQLAQNERSPFKKRFFKSESTKLKAFESILERAEFCLCISQTDCAYFEKRLVQPKVIELPAFHPSERVTSKEGNGDFALYHGNLSVAENAHAAKHLIEHIFDDSSVPLIVAGMNPPNWLKSIVNKTKNVKLVSNPSEQDLSELIQNAQVNCLYTNQISGLKLKLLNVLFNGRHCLVNSKMITGSGLEDLCTVTDNAQAYKAHLATLMKKPFETADLQHREKLLRAFNNAENAKKLVEQINR